MKNGEGCDCVFSDSTVLSTDPKQSSIWVAMKEVNSIPARHSATAPEMILKGFSAFSGCVICSSSVWFHQYDVNEFVNVVKF